MRTPTNNLEVAFGRDSNTNGVLEAGEVETVYGWRNGANINGTSVFTNLSIAVPVWLYQPEWNLMRITRRGISTPSEWFSCKIGYSSFCVTIR